MAASLFALGLPVSSAAPSEATFNYLRSEDGGDGFGPLRQLDDVDDGLNITQVDAAGGTVHALFDTANGEPGQVFHRRSPDHGATFGEARRLDLVDADGAPDEGQSTEADLHAEGTTVHVVWTNNPLDGDGDVDPCCVDPSRDDIFYTRSTDDGGSFPVPVNLTDSPRDHNRDPDLAGDGDLVAIAYEGQIKVDDDGDEYPEDEERGDQVLVRVSRDGGESWGDETLLSADPFAKQNEPALAVAGDGVHVVFEDEDEARSDEIGMDVVQVVYARSADRGGSFSEAVALPGQDNLSAESVAVAAAGSAVHVVACRVDDELDPSDPADVLYWRSHDGGASFADPVAIVERTDECGGTAIDASDDGAHLHVAATYDAVGEGDVFYLRSPDGGGGWEAPRRLSVNPGDSADPSLAVDPADASRVHLSWTDESDFLLALDHPQDLPDGEGGTLAAAPEDVLRYRGGSFEVVIDGSDVGLDLPVDALARIGPDEFVLSFARAGDVEGAGRVGTSDLVRFTATRLGVDTEGGFDRYFDGGEIGLDEDGEGIDAVDVVGDDVYLSTRGGFSAGGLTGSGDDVLLCRAATTVSETACDELVVALRGSDAGLEGLGLDALSFNEDGNGPEGIAALSVRDDFSLPEAAGTGSDLLACAFPEVDDEVDDPAPGTDLSDCGSETVPLRVVLDGDGNGIVGGLTAVHVEKNEDEGW